MNVHVRTLADGTGRVKIHWFRHDPAGPIRTGTVTHTLAVGGKLQTLVLGGKSGQVVCRPTLNTLNSPMTPAGAVEPLPVTGEVVGVTCPECIAHPQFKEAWDELVKMRQERGHEAQMAHQGD